MVTPYKISPPAAKHCGSTEPALLGQGCEGHPASPEPWMPILQSAPAQIVPATAYRRPMKFVWNVYMLVNLQP
jgi:hypothetical protein